MMVCVGGVPVVVPTTELKNVRDNILNSLKMVSIQKRRTDGGRSRGAVRGTARRDPTVFRVSPSL
jgi:hypothetical protein